MMRSQNKKIYPLLVESLDHMKLTPAKKEFARAVLRAAIEYACARQAGFVLVPREKIPATAQKTSDARR